MMTSSCMIEKLLAEEYKIINIFFFSEKVLSKWVKIKEGNYHLVLCNSIILVFNLNLC